MKKILIIFFIFATTNLQAKNFVKNTNYKYCNYHNFTYFLLDVYDIYLCVNDKKFLSSEKIYDNNFSIFIQYNMNFSNKELAKSSIEEMNRYYNISDIMQQQYYQELLNIFPNVKKTDIIEARYKDGITTLYHNQKISGKINNNNFSKIFLDIWLHKNNKYKEMIEDLFQKNLF